MSHVYVATESGAIRLWDTHEGVTFRTFPDTKKVKRDRHTNDPVVREPQHVTSITLHQTAVLGGFGVTSRQLARQPKDLPDDERSALARLARYRNTPYHGIYSPAAQSSVIQWPAWVYSYHGHKSNRYSLGWAYDGKIPGDTLDVEGARESLRHLLEYARTAGCDIRHLEGHRQHAGARGGDPGEEIWREIAHPIASEFGLTFTGRVTGSGKVIPSAWDPAPFSQSRCTR